MYVCSFACLWSSSALQCPAYGFGCSKGTLQRICEQPVEIYVAFMMSLYVLFNSTIVTASVRWRRRRSFRFIDIIIFMRRDILQMKFMRDECQFSTLNQNIYLKIGIF